MKYLDKVRVITDKYEEKGVTKGMIGTILLPEIRNNTFCVFFENEDTFADNDGLAIYVEDLEVIEISDISTEDLLEILPNKNPDWWCIVDSGYIKNLKGKKKNKIPYVYKS